MGLVRASWGSYHQPAPHCILWHSWSTAGLYLGGKGKTGTLCQWCWAGGCAPGGESAEMQPQGVLCPQTVAATPPHLQHTGICGKRGRIPAGNVPTCPRAPVWFMHTLPTAPAALFVCWCFFSHSLFSFKPTHGAVCRCLVPVWPQSWPGSPLAFQGRWDTEVSMLVLLLFCVTVKALAHNCSVHHPGSLWRSLACTCVFNCPVQCASCPLL